MIMKNRLPIYLIMLMLAAVPCIRIAQACNIPVFRYALERWEPSEYILEVYRKEELSPQETKLLDELKNFSVERGGQLNIAVNVSGTDAGHFDPEILPELPGMVLYFPDDTTRGNPIWAGKLDKENITRLIDSPARREVREKLQEGKTALFLVLSSSRGESNQEKKDFLRVVLQQAEKEIYITAPGTDIHGNPIKNPDFSHTDLAFTSVFVDRMDPEEEILARILLGTEQDLWNYDVPIAFPVFGRGRILYALVGDGINKDMVYRACSAVTGWCSCIVKDDNPGTDMLISADWTSGLGESWIEPEELPQLTGLSSFSAQESELNNQIPEFFSAGESSLDSQVLPETAVPEERAETGKFFFLLMAALLVSIIILSWTLFRKRAK
jgi:hypothetical protein